MVRDRSPGCGWDLSTVKALCEVLGKPLAAVSMLEALAVTHGHEGEVVTAVLDAGRGEVYVGEYRVSKQEHNWCESPCQSWPNLLAQTPSPGARIVTPFPKIAEALVAAQMGCRALVTAAAGGCDWPHRTPQASGRRRRRSCNARRQLHPALGRRTLRSAQALISC